MSIFRHSHSHEIHDIGHNINLVNRIYALTRVVKFTHTRIDPILTPSNLIVAESGTLNIDSRFSDHIASVRL